jgi:hypothetical protein
MSKAEVLGQEVVRIAPRLIAPPGFFEKYVRVVETGEVLEEEFSHFQ